MDQSITLNNQLTKIDDLSSKLLGVYIHFSQVDAFTRALNLNICYKIRKIVNNWE